MKEFQLQELDLFNRRLELTLWLGTILIPLFAVLDYVVVRPWFNHFLLLRLFCAGAFLVMLLLHRRNIGHRQPFVMTLFATSLAAALISAMVIYLGGAASTYYIGIIMVMITCTAILPLTTLQTIKIGCIVFLVYAVPVFFFSEMSGTNLALLFNNSFFFFFFAVITVVQNMQDYQTRYREYLLRKDLDIKAKELNNYATNLEGIVKERVQELAESELRYGELYNNIIDIVVLINERGEILAANPSFSEIAGKDRQQSFLNIIHDNDREYVSRKIINPDCSDLKGIHFRMISDQGRVVEIECNARCMLRDNVFIGFQLVMRDVTARNKLERDLLSSLRQTEEARQATILGLAKLAEYRDMNTGGHLERIREFARSLAYEMTKLPSYRNYITSKYIDHVYQSSVLHDIGKVGIPDAILLKPGKLTEEEFSLIRQHSVYGGDILKTIEEQTGGGETFLSMGKIIAYHHHERWDGSGYPEGLSGLDIPLSTRLVALADVYDALTSDRSYKNAFSHEVAVKIITAERNKHFDPDVVDAFLANADRFKKIRHQMLN